MASLSPKGKTDVKERFFRYFQLEITALQEQMARLPETPVAGGERSDAVDHCLAGIARLSREVQDVSPYVPSYDQKTYSDAIKALSEKLTKTRASFTPRPKFTFKSAMRSRTVSLSDAAQLAAQQRGRLHPSAANDSSTGSSMVPTPDPSSPPSEVAVGIAVDGTPVQKAAIEGAEVNGTKLNGTVASGVSISNETEAHIVLAKSASTASAGTVSNIKKSFIDMSGATSSAPFPGLTVKSVSNSLVVCGQVNGAIHVTGVEGGVVVVACRQFRMHECKKVDVYLHCGSRPIIEDCEEIRFAPLPETYTTETQTQTQNQWDQVDDFKWLKSEPNPHWRILPDAERTADTVWKDMAKSGQLSQIFERLSLAS